jgi:alkylated DNA nucleotide flippase Atl1
MAQQNPSLEPLQNQWKEIYQVHLPEAARSNAPTQVPYHPTPPSPHKHKPQLTHRTSQSKWPVTLDHCFARIILDHTVGINAPWSSKLKSPAYRNMSAKQLQASINLGKKILRGNADLVDLDNRSLELRGKRKRGDDSGRITVRRKRKWEVVEDVLEINDMPKKRVGSPPSLGDDGVLEINDTPKKRVDSPPSLGDDDVSNERSRYFTTVKASSARPKEGKGEDFTPYLKKIALSHKTPFQKKVLSLLCQIPRGKYTTYAAISKHLSSCPRAVGNAIRNNPFAPQVSRVLGVLSSYSDYSQNKPVIRMVQTY